MQQDPRHKKRKIVPRRLDYVRARVRRILMCPIRGSNSAIMATVRVRICVGVRVRLKVIVGYGMGIKVGIRVRFRDSIEVELGVKVLDLRLGLGYLRSICESIDSHLAICNWISHWPSS